MSVFSNIFGKRKLNSPVDLSVLEVDLHSHILPGIDDGAENVRDSIKMVKQLMGMGYRKLITTPHIMSDNYKNTPQIINRVRKDFGRELKQAGIKAELDVAAEYLLDDGLIDHIEKYEALTVKGNYMLIELPYFTEPPNIYDVIFQLSVKGYKVVLAHPERYIYWYDNFAKFEMLKERNVFFQLNILTFADAYLFPVRRIAEKLSEQGMVEFLGTDFHNPEQLQLLERALYEPALARLIESGKLMNHML